MSAKHTPGPWEYFEREEWGGPYPRGRYGSVRTASGKDDFVIVNGCAPGGRRDEANANARLIAAAPDLLVALQAVQQWADEQGIAIPVRCGVRAAITKATGEA